MDHVYDNRRDMDAGSAALILQLQREDLEALSSSKNGENDKADMSDIDIALQLQLDEIKSMETYRTDRIMSRSHAMAEHTDRQVLQDATRIETQARQDRGFARRLGPQPPRVVTQPPHNEAQPPVAEPNSKKRKLDLTGHVRNAGNEEPASQRVRIGDTSSNDQTPRHASSRGSRFGFGFGSHLGQSSRAEPSGKPLKPCIVCNDKKEPDDLLNVSCNHDYCAKCITEYFQHSITDESLYPPRCCQQEIPLELASTIMTDQKLIGTFKEKGIEFGSKNRTYCHESTCSQFIPDVYIQDDIATCPGCASWTCAICKAASHIGDCPQDENLQQLLQLAEEQGWQRCSECHRVIDLSIGCNHMTCHCGSEFCFACGTPWKFCKCDWWDEERLFERARQIDNRPAARQPRNPGHEMYQRPRGLEHIIGELRRNQECEQHDWVYVDSPGRCEMCGYSGWRFIYECDQCHTNACRNCHLHRL